MRTLTLLATLALVGCAQAPKSLYQWDGYQSALYEHLKSNGGDPGAQIAKLEAQVQKNEATGAASPPGLRAHLALLHARMGDDQAARAHLEAERARFPESAAYVDFLLKSRAKPAASAAPAGAASQPNT
jgi:hypothetical protein